MSAASGRGTSAAAAAQPDAGAQQLLAYLSSSLAQLEAIGGEPDEESRSKLAALSRALNCDEGGGGAAASSAAGAAGSARASRKAGRASGRRQQQQQEELDEAGMMALLNR